MKLLLKKVRKSIDLADFLCFFSFYIKKISFMKNLILLVLSIFITNSVFSQIPNASFEVGEQIDNYVQQPLWQSFFLLAVTETKSK
jgi:hypothetical protein